MQDFCELLHSEPLDRERALWFVSDVIDQDAVERVNGCNAVCLPTGATWDELDSKDVAGFPAIVIASTDSKWRREAIEELGSIARGVPLIEIRDGFKGSANIAGFARKYGAEGLGDLLREGKEIPARGVLNLPDVKWQKQEYICRSGIPSLDEKIGGFGVGELSVWTGKRGEGKSTLLGQMLLSAIDQGQSVFAYSGELMGWQFKDWIMTQAAGPGNVTAVQRKDSNHISYFASKSIQWNIDRWFNGKFWLYDNSLPGSYTPEALLSMMKQVHRQYGVKVFLLDNLMSLQIQGRDFYRAQSELVGSLVSFAKQTGTHVHLVCHPRKTGDAEIEGDDVSGSGDILNRADNGFSLKRRGADPTGKQVAELKILKSRSTGARGDIGLNYDPTCRRFAGIGQSHNWQYGWERMGFIECEEQTPFDGM
jgi:twinkle protein